MNAAFTTIDYLKVHPSYLSVYSQRVYDSPRSFSNEKSISNLQKNTHRNIMSKKAISKCKASINYLLLQSCAKSNYSRLNFNDVKFRMVFITLTLSAPQFHSDNVIKREMLNIFLIESKRIWDIKNYVWRSEKQLNGNIHFHILFDKFIPWQEIRSLWNRMQLKMGYIAAYRLNQQVWNSNGFRPRPELFSKWPLKEQLKAYKIGLKSNWSNPNSTDIHSVRLIHNVAAYVTKYMTKAYVCKHVQVSRSNVEYLYDKQEFEKSVSPGALRFLRNCAEIGRLWGCSVQLSHLSGGAAVVDSAIADEIGKIKRHPAVKSIEEAYCNVYIAPIELAVALHCINIVQLLSEFVVQRFILESVEQPCHQSQGQGIFYNFSL